MCVCVCPLSDSKDSRVVKSTSTLVDQHVNSQAASKSNSQGPGRLSVQVNKTPAIFIFNGPIEFHAVKSETRHTKKSLHSNSTF